MKKILNRIKNNKRYIWYILLIIVILGVFLRAYHFNETQNFSKDEIRDARIIQKMMVSKNFLIMGAHAQGTKFALGPAYYYLEYVSALVFGNIPQSLAYPVLFFSILTIPLLFMVLRKFFSNPISLIVTAIYSTSFYAVEFSRFAWNPNPLPFFVIALFWLLLKMVEEKKEPKIIWPILTGIVVGIGIQLHTLAIIIFLALIAIYFIFFLVKKYPLSKSLLLVIAMIIVVNIPQIIQGINNHGANAQAFANTFLRKTTLKHSRAEYLFEEIGCYTQGNEYILTPYGNNDSGSGSCGILNLSSKKLTDNLRHGVIIILALGLFISGLTFLFYHLRKENEEKKKNFLGLTALYFVLSFIAFFSIAFSFAPRYFLIIFFLPFFFLGFCFKFLIEKFKKNGLIITVIIAVILIVLNFMGIEKVFLASSNPNHADAEAYPGMTIMNAKLISDYITKEVPNYREKTIYVYSTSEPRAVRYFLKKNKANSKIGILKNMRSRKEKETNAIFFFIKDSSAKKQGAYNSEYFIIGSTTINGYDILTLEKNINQVN